MVGSLLLGVTLTGWVFLTVTVSTGIVGVVMFMLGSQRLHYVWGLFCLAVCIWTGAFFFIFQSHDPTVAFFWWRIAYVGIILIPFTYLHFVLELTKKANVLAVGLLYAFGILLVYIDLSSNLIVNSISLISSEFYFNYPAADLHPLLMVVFVTLVLIAHWLEYKAYFSSTDQNFKRQTRLLFAVMLVGFIGSTLIFFNAYGIFVNPIIGVATIIAPPVVAYAMLRYHLFNVRVVLAQFLTFVIVAFAIFRIAVSTSHQEIIFNTVMLAVTAGVGVYLIFSVRREVEQREQIQALAAELEIKNVKLTELDKLKSQFLSIATHELRTPLTIVRNFIALILDGSYGKVPPAVEEGGRQVFERVTDMAHSVDTYLNVSRIEQGKIKYDFTPEDLTRLVSTAFSGMKANAEKKGLSLTLTVGKGAETMRGAFDAPKITEVLINLIDNSIKYTPKGSITATLEKAGPQRARLTIKDTGVGMTQKTMQNLFKLFSPGEDSKKINPASTGVGLYVSRAHAEAHKGTLTASSAGEGKGSQFVLELPIS